jgi:rubrerythrin
MRPCVCGYDFRQHVLAEPPPFKSYAVIADAEYKKFARAEKKVLLAKNKTEKSKAIAKASQYVGSLAICPECGTLMLDRPDAECYEALTRVQLPGPPSS